LVAKVEDHYEASLVDFAGVAAGAGGAGVVPDLAHYPAAPDPYAYSDAAAGAASSRDHPAGAAAGDYRYARAAEHCSA
jgi:hypothetical protein